MLKRKPLLSGRVRRIGQIITAGVMVFATSASASVFCYGTAKAYVNATTPSSDFILNEDGTAVHKPTNLMWMRCMVGQTFASGDQPCFGSSQQFTWTNTPTGTYRNTRGVLPFVHDYEYAGYSDWRLPNRNELTSILEARCESPALNYRVFPMTSNQTMFSSTPSFTGEARDAWAMNTSWGGSLFLSSRLWTYHGALLVRDIKD